LRQEDEQLRTWWARALRLGATPTAAVGWLELMAEVDIRSAVTAIRAPTLVAHRRGDVIVPVGNGRQPRGHARAILRACSAHRSIVNATISIRRAPAATR
jgi:pimeloyl-ACP methyl ester carboxylesterase